MNAGTRPIDRAEATANEAKTLQAERVRQLYDNAEIGMMATLLNSLVTVIVLRNVVPIRFLLTWLFCLVLVTVFRFYLVSRFRRSTSQQDTLDTHRHGRSFIGGLAVSGVVWGSAGLFLFPIGSVPHQIFLAFVVGGMVAGAAGTFSAVMGAFFAYSIPALTPLILRFFAVGDEMHLAMGLMLVLFGLLLTNTARQVNAAMVTSVELRVKNTKQDGYRQRIEEELRSYQQNVEQIVASRTLELQKEVDFLRRHLDEYVRLDEEFRERKRIERTGESNETEES